MQTYRVVVQLALESLWQVLGHNDSYCFADTALLQEMNLRDLTKKLGRNKGLNVDAVQLFACQLLIALR